MAIFLKEYCHLATQGPGQGATQTLPRLYIKQDVPLVQNFEGQGLGFRLQGSHCAHGQGSSICLRTFIIWRNNLQLAKKKPIHNLDKYNSHSAPAALSAVYNSITSMEWIRSSSAKCWRHARRVLTYGLCCRQVGENPKTMSHSRDRADHMLGAHNTCALWI